MRKGERKTDRHMQAVQIIKKQLTERNTEAVERECTQKTKVTGSYPA